MLVSASCHCYNNRSPVTSETAPAATQRSATVGKQTPGQGAKQHGYGRGLYLIEDGTLYDGMTKTQAEEVLGPPISQRDGLIEWYDNPGHMWHVAPFFRAELRDGKLYNWYTGHR